MVGGGWWVVVGPFVQRLRHIFAPFHRARFRQRQRRRPRATSCGLCFLFISLDIELLDDCALIGGLWGGVVTHIESSGPARIVRGPCAGNGACRAVERRRKDTGCTATSTSFWDQFHVSLCSDTTPPPAARCALLGAHAYWVLICANLCLHSDVMTPDL